MANNIDAKSHVLKTSLSQSTGSARIKMNRTNTELSDKNDFNYFIVVQIVRDMGVCTHVCMYVNLYWKYW